MAVERRAAYALASIHARRRDADHPQLGVWTPHRRFVAFQHDTLLVDLALEFEMGSDDANRHALAFRWSFAREGGKSEGNRWVWSSFLAREGASRSAYLRISAAAAEI